MKAHNKYLVLAAAAPLLFNTPATAEISVTAELDNFISSGDAGDGWAELRQSYSASVVPGLVYDFSQAGEVQLQVVWQAPAGLQFAVNFPEEATYGSNLFAGWDRSVGSWEGGSVLFNNRSVTVTGASEGLVVPQSNYYIIYNNPDTLFNIALGSHQPLGQTITFTAITFTATIPASYAQNLNIEAADLFSLGAVASGPTLPGGRYELLSLQPIPEPSTYAALLGALALGIVAMRRKRRG